MANKCDNAKMIYSRRQTMTGDSEQINILTEIKSFGKIMHSKIIPVTQTTKSL